jgi:choline-sulfatase
MNIYEPQAFDSPSGGLYARKSELAAEQPALVGRAASVRTQRYTFVQRPQGLSELYDRQADPSELNNLIGQRSHARVQDMLERRLLDWYINTTGVPADTRNSRDVPSFTAPLAPKADGAAATAILDR